MFKSFNSYSQSRETLAFDTRLTRLCEGIVHSGLTFDEFWVGVGLDTLVQDYHKDENALLEAFATNLLRYAGHDVLVETNIWEALRRTKYPRSKSGPNDAFAGLNEPDEEGDGEDYPEIPGPRERVKSGPNDAFAGLSDDDVPTADPVDDDYPEIAGPRGKTKSGPNDAFAGLGGKEPRDTSRYDHRARLDRAASGEEPFADRKPRSGPNPAFADLDKGDDFLSRAGRGEAEIAGPRGKTRTTGNPAFAGLDDRNVPTADPVDDNDFFGQLDRGETSISRKPKRPGAADFAGFDRLPKSSPAAKPKVTPSSPPAAAPKPRPQYKRPVPVAAGPMGDDEEMATASGPSLYGRMKSGLSGGLGAVGSGLGKVGSGLGKLGGGLSSGLGKFGSWFKGGGGGNVPMPTNNGPKRPGAPVPMPTNNPAARAGGKVPVDAPDGEPTDWGAITGQGNRANVVDKSNGYTRPGQKYQRPGQPAAAPTTAPSSQSGKSFANVPSKPMARRPAPGAAAGQGGNAKAIPVSPPQGQAQGGPDLSKHQKTVDGMIQQVKNDFNAAMHDFLKKAEARTAGPGGSPHAWRIAHLFAQKMKAAGDQFTLNVVNKQPTWMSDYQKKAQAMQQGMTAANQKGIKDRGGVSPNVTAGPPMPPQAGPQYGHPRLGDTPTAPAATQAPAAGGVPQMGGPPSPADMWSMNGAPNTVYAPAGTPFANQYQLNTDPMAQTFNMGMSPVVPGVNTRVRSNMPRPQAGNTVGMENVSHEDQQFLESLSRQAKRSDKHNSWGV